jgi:protein-disulfide isomerase
VYRIRGGPEPRIAACLCPRRASLTQYSSRAAAASAAAADAGRFHEYARLLFENQPPEGSLGLSDDQLIELGDGIGIAEPAFAVAIQRGTYVPWPSFVTRRATERGVAGTPSVFVDGMPVPARPDSITAAVERVLPSFADGLGCCRTLLRGGATSGRSG